MDITTLRIAATLLCFAAFVRTVGWGWTWPQPPRFDPGSRVRFAQ